MVTLFSYVSPHSYITHCWNPERKEDAIASAGSEDISNKKHIPLATYH